MDRTEPRHPINYVSKRTGLSTHVIRVWERRYGAVEPVRTSTNRRLYSDADIDRLRLLKAVTDAGHTIGHIATLPGQELHELAASCLTAPLRTLAAPRPVADGGADVFEATPESFLSRCQDAVRKLDGETLDAALLEASISLSQFKVVDEVVAPLMRWVGDEWHESRLRVAHEHMASAVVRTFLSNLRAAYTRDEFAPVVVIATPSGQSHEIGAQLAAVVAAMEGWHDVYFGANLPITEIANAARETRARAVALGVTYVTDRASLLRDIQELRRFLPESVALVLGGVGATQHRDIFERFGIYCTDDLGELRDVLRALASGAPPGGNGKPSPSRENAPG